MPVNITINIQTFFCSCWISIQSEEVYCKASLLSIGCFLLMFCDTTITSNRNVYPFLLFCKLSDHSSSEYSDSFQLLFLSVTNSSLQFTLLPIHDFSCSFPMICWIQQFFNMRSQQLGFSCFFPLLSLLYLFPLWVSQMFDTQVFHQISLLLSIHLT